MIIRKNNHVKFTKLACPTLGRTSRSTAEINAPQFALPQNNRSPRLHSAQQQIREKEQICWNINISKYIYKPIGQNKSIGLY